MDKILQGDVREVIKTLSNESVHCVITSPPYFGLRDYGMPAQIGLEETPEAYTQKMVELFREVRRVLKDDGTLWLNLGDSYSGSGKGAYGDGVVRLTDKSKKQKTSSGTTQGIFTKPTTGLKPKDLIGIPWRVAFALQQDGWYLRQDIIWHKPNPMPESVTDRCTKAHEYIFLLSKSPKYYFDHAAIKEPTVCTDPREIKSGLVRKRSVWSVTTRPYKGAHFATFPEALIEPMILAGCPLGGVCFDPFMGAGTTAVVAKKLQRNYIGIELNPSYITLAETRILNTLTPLPL